MDPTEWREINELVVQCTAALFESCNVQLQYLGVASKQDPPFDTTLAVIGYAGEQMRGSVLLSAPDPLLKTTHPSGASATDDDLLDWAGELSNQLLGRIKNQLRGRGVIIQMSTPMILTGLHLRISSLRSAECIAHKFALGESHKFALGDARVQVRFEAIVEPGVRLPSVPPEVPPAREGDVLIF